MHIFTLLLFSVFVIVGATTSFVVGRVHSDACAEKKSLKSNISSHSNEMVPATLDQSCSLHLNIDTPSSASTTQSRIYTFDFDDVVNIREKIGVYECARYGKLLVKLTIQEPRKVGKFLWNWRAIKARVKELSNQMHGATKIIHTLSAELVAKGHLDITPHTDDIIAYFVKPKPIWPIINYIKELKKQGHVVIGATNQDYFHNKCIRAKMAEQGVDLDELFDAIVISHTTNQAQHRALSNALIHEIEPGIYMPCSPEGHKPHAHFYEAVKAVGTRLVPSVSLLIHTDDRIENIHGAQSVEGFAAVHFNLTDGKSARRCTEAELDAAFLAWKYEIEKIN